MLHSISKNDASKKFYFGKKYMAWLVCAVLFVSVFAYTITFVRDTQTLEKCMAYPYANASKLEKIENKTVAEKNCIVYLSTHNADGIQELYLLKNKRLFGLLDVQRYVTLNHEASVMEKVGFFPALAPSDTQSEPIDWYFYSQNELQINNMVCTFNTSGGAQVTREFSCNVDEPFFCCIPALQGNLRLESMVGYNTNGEQVYARNTGLFLSA